ncbi:hypothetical protein [uncultured Bradyrhizobium sp.]|uniref:hypothetical protein n=1 Tax=Bradyrhizobium sp. TaxID=376 RepID=UPI00260DFBDC|nr:hypothetical protein [uncultured Bradyrhizobium sp.]
MDLFDLLDERFDNWLCQTAIAHRDNNGEEGLNFCNADVLAASATLSTSCSE